ncbi:MAG: adenylosuccinate synthase [Saprospirales bacterium]|nr:MAG: adenylosuccinate synthase [Saprospirales bacterium]
MAVDVLVGLQWGDEGKGKIVDLLSEKYDVICRFQGGPNAGHTIEIGDQKHVLHTIPSGIFRKHTINLVGNGVVIDPITFIREIEGLMNSGLDCTKNLYISLKAHLILPTHRLLDAASEAQKGAQKIGSTLRGIGPTYMDKTGRNGLRAGDVLKDNLAERYEQLKQKHLKLASIYPNIDFDLESEEKKWFEAVEKMRGLNFVNGEYFLNELLAEGKSILAEGAQGSMLDITYGTYPFVTSSNTITAGVCTGLGIAPSSIGKVIGITKAYCTRVGSGPFPTELFDQYGETLMQAGHEYGATTGRKRRCGWIDLPQLKYVIMLNGVTDLVVTKLDVLSAIDQFKAGERYQLIDGTMSEQVPYEMETDIRNVEYQTFKSWKEELGAVRSFDQLPPGARQFITYLEKSLNTRVSMVSVGPERNETILR